MLNDLNIDVMAINGTWLGENILDQEVKVNGYEIICHNQWWYLFLHSIKH